MGNIIEYAQSNMNTMAQQPFNAVDSLVLSQLSYLRFERIVPLISGRAAPVKMGELLKAELFDSIFQNLLDVENNKRFLFVMAASPRFRNIDMNYYTNLYDPVLEKQFSAVAFLLDDRTAYIAFRGTDSTFIGWKEDFNMAYTSPIPSQEASVSYINAVAKKIPRTVKLRTGGHSKGGNLAVYAAIKCAPEVQKRIISVYNHDGPGFKDSLFESAGFLKIKDRIHTTLPEESLVGMLLQHHEDYTVIKSRRHGIMQHDPFSWNIENDDFVYTDQIKSGAMHRNKALNDWLNQMTEEKRKQIVDVLFQIIDTPAADNLHELSDDWRGNVGAMLGAFKNIDAETRKFVSQAIGELAKLSLKNMFSRNSRASTHEEN